MVRTVVSMVIGAGLGVLLAGTPGGILGVLCGAAVGLLWALVPDPPAGVPAGVAAHSEQQDVLCIPKGQVAQSVLVRDDRTGRWLDVVSCSLCPEGAVRCGKRCLRLLNESIEAPREPAVPEAVG